MLLSSPSSTMTTEVTVTYSIEQNIECLNDLSADKSKKSSYRHKVRYTWILSQCLYHARCVLNSTCWLNLFTGRSKAHCKIVGSRGAGTKIILCLYPPGNGSDDGNQTEEKSTTRRIHHHRAPFSQKSAVHGYGKNDTVAISALLSVLDSTENRQPHLIVDKFGLFFPWPWGKICDNICMYFLLQRPLSHHQMVLNIFPEPKRFELAFPNIICLSFKFSLNLTSVRSLQCYIAEKSRQRNYVTSRTKQSHFLVLIRRY